jgi:oxalate decarboxylase/phosphoglucose isomerase-like protein (cupin superfamily)
MLEEILKFRRKDLEKKGYKINDRKLSSLRPLFSDDYKQMEIALSEGDIVYSGAEHKGKPKLPNITYFPVIAEVRGILMNSSMGHQHTQSQKDDPRLFQEIYEFLGYGAMLIRNVSGTTLYILKPNEKVIVGTSDNMTIINTGQYPLVTVDYANPDMNSSNKDLEQQIGPLILGRSSVKGILFKLNPEYIKRGLLKGSEDNTFVRIRDCRLGQELYERLYECRKQFESSGINLVFGGNIPAELKSEFSRPLLELVIEQNEALLSALKIDPLRFPRFGDANILYDESGSRIGTAS